MIRAIIGTGSNTRAFTLDENTTLRSALEEAGVDYSIGAPSLDGITLRPGDLDKTFADHGITESCYLLSVVKATNAAVIKIIGNVAVVESAAKLDTVEKLQKYRPEALRLYEGTGKDKEEIFAVGAAPRGNGSINKYGASFGTTPTVDGNAIITLEIPEGTSDPKKWAIDKIGTAILKLNKVEAQFAAKIDEIDAELADIESNISLL